MVDADSVLTRMRLKRRLRFWRGCAVLVLFAGVVAALWTSSGAGKKGAFLPEDQGYIARIVIDGIVTNRYEQQQAIRGIAKQEDVHGVIVHIDTPGGTAAGGEALYEALKALATEKPLVAVMGSMATSAGYMAALPAAHIMARRTSLTGSVGVLLQSPDVTELANKIGIKINHFKSGELKGSPSVTSPVTPQEEAMLQALINDSQAVFLSMVSEHRNLDEAAKEKMADGRVFTGMQAVANGLIDGIGGEVEARAWLQENHQLAEDIQIKEYRLLSRKKQLEMWLQKQMAGWSSFWSKLQMHGLLFLS